MKKYIWIVGSGCIIALIIWGIWYFNPNVIFERKFQFQLPKNVEKIHTAYSFYYDSLEMKVSFRDKDYQTIVEGIKHFAEDNTRKVDLKNEVEMLPIRAFCNFWEKDKEEAVLAYCGYKQGRWRDKTRNICILITKDKENEEQYFLHVYY